MSDLIITTASSDFLNITSTNKVRNPTFKVVNGYFEQPYFQTELSLKHSDVFVKFIKKVESLVRTHPDYQRYMKEYLRDEVGLTTCSIFSNINYTMAPIEMHHGPIMNLFDICAIVTQYLLIRQGHCCTFEVAELVLEEHYENNIQIVPLCETAHQLQHAWNRYINPKQAFGNLRRFIEKYDIAIDARQKETISKILEMSEQHDTDFSDFFEVKDEMKGWKHLSDGSEYIEHEEEEI